MPELRRRQQRILPPSVRVGADVPWVDPGELRLRWWQVLRSATGLTVMVLLLGMLLAITIGTVLLLGFFLIDHLVG